MSRFMTAPRAAGDREAGVPCPHRDAAMVRGEQAVVCPTCAAPHHEACWHAAGGCGSYVCTPARPGARRRNGPALVVTAGDLDRAVPLPARPAVAPPAPEPPPARRRTSPLAVAAFVCALAGIFLFGVPGAVAVLLGSLALGSIHHTRQKGTGFALVGVLLGLVDVVGWIVGVVVVLSHHGPVGVSLDDFEPDLAALENLDPPIGRAMRANVLIQSHAGWRGLGGVSIGSGIILEVKNGQATILTNRHVVDPDFAAEAPAGDAVPGAALEVKTVTGSTAPGRATWIAPGGLDLALVQAAVGPGADAAKWDLGRRRPRIGDPVFAIGNPHQLGWTHTQGTVSQLRVRHTTGRPVRIIQTQTAINPGNSGGGLYDREGYLIGVNTWAEDKRVSEGLNFAISLEALADANPPGIELRPRRAGAARP